MPPGIPSPAQDGQHDKRRFPVKQIDQKQLGRTRSECGQYFGSVPVHGLFGAFASWDQVLHKILVAPARVDARLRFEGFEALP